jgi:hypothetical protein
MGEFVFKTDEYSRDFCLEIASIMKREFNIKHEEAIGRINKKWGHLSTIVDNWVVFHFHPEEWAYNIYYGSDVLYEKEVDYKKLKPIPYPEED